MEVVMDYFPYVVIGAGAAGLVVASGLSKAGKEVLLVERGNFGGDCTNFGCIPSKSLIASAKTAHAIRMAKELGIDIPEFDLGCDGALKRTRKIVEGIRKKEEPDALKKLGIKTITGTASFIDAHTIAVYDEEDNETLFHGKHFIIATGSSTQIPDIKGLEKSPFLTNETIFDLKKVPKTIAFLGGGPIGCELAQAFSRLGSEVHLIQRGKELLPREEPEVQKLIAKLFKKEGIHLHLDIDINEVFYKKKEFTVGDITVDQLVVATGRQPNIDHLNLDAAGVRHTDATIEIDEYGRTAQNHIWAIGDCVGTPFFTHYAENQARGVLASLLLPWNKRRSKQAIPRTTYTDPEIASIGIGQNEAEQLFGKNKIAVYSLPFSDVDRAVTAGRTEGMIKVVTKKWSSKILGATIVGERAGEMIMEIATAMHNGTPLRKLSDLIHPYPTYNEAIRKTADRYLTETILGVFK